MLWVGAYIQPRGSPMSNSYTYVYLIGSLLFVPIWALLFWRSPASDRKSTRLNSSHGYISYAVFCLKKKKNVRVTSLLERQPRNPDEHVGDSVLLVKGRQQNLAALEVRVRGLSIWDLVSSSILQRR